MKQKQKWGKRKLGKMIFLYKTSKNTNLYEQSPTKQRILTNPKETQSLFDWRSLQVKS